MNSAKEKKEAYLQIRTSIKKLIHIEAKELSQEFKDENSDNLFYEASNIYQMKELSDLFNTLIKFGDDRYLRNE